MADIGIVPSVYDHCPYTALEMMANNIPLIVSRINGLDELLDDTLCIFINAVLSIEGDISFDIKDLSNTILMLSLNKSLRSELTARSFEVLTERFAFSEGVANFYVLTFKLCGNSSVLVIPLMVAYSCT